MLLFLLVLLLPSQLSHHFWPSWSLINGIRSDYLSPTLYLTDLIILGLMIFSSITFRKNTTSVLRATPSYLGGGRGVVLIILITLNIFFSTNPQASIYKWIRVYEYYWLFKYLVNNIRYSVFSVRFGLSLAVVWTSFLAWSQFIIQHSIGGLWYWLGERTFSVSTLGISRIFLGFGNWELGFVLRPYATMPHPNALAGFLLVGGLLILSITPRPPLNLRGGVRRTEVIYWLAVLSAFLTIPLTFSKSAILIEIGLIIFWLVRKYSKLLLVLFIVPMVLYFYLPSSPDSIPERIVLNQKAVETIKSNPVFGVGLGNSVSLLPSLRQPTHNVFLLLMVELGLPVILAIGYWSIAVGKKLLRTKNYELITIALVVLATGMVDHYWITLHQNILLLVVLLALTKVQLMTKNDNI
ncbi:MAG: hypothetical protein UU93_C0001G0016 [Candidatus Amesbacteria bacterium GW2011_GWA2_42_12]|uniref:O-antigen ligase-related domain-containing protein n=1 Tax=Candidatus Amesbacteria bacterium GW2011_GWA2_42_12 TaxID=1618356 RepID=A0A0G0Y8Z5_9BACT|nr:MAG: hypothetical protein UU93_C0001G0016 [Candidatus Amesbacteria bacterium GW2011_GWA2_42_12]